MRTTRRHKRGTALLAVLWLSAALAAIALSVAAAVRSETERAGTTSDSVRGYFLAAGAIERALLYMEWAPLGMGPDRRSRYYNSDTPRLNFDFPDGVATVDIISESSKLDINGATEEQLYRLGEALGADPERAREISLAIVDWRTAAPPGAPPSVFDDHYLALTPSFRGRHASFQEIEELLLVKGMTPELFYGTYERDTSGRLVPRPGFRDCLTVYGTGMLDVNFAAPAAFAAIGVPPDTVSAIVDFRKHDFFRTREQLAGIAQGVPGFERLTIGGGSTLTFRAAAHLKRPDGSISPDARGAAALVKFPTSPRPTERYTILRWYDNAWVQ